MKALKPLAAKGKGSRAAVILLRHDVLDPLTPEFDAPMLTTVSLKDAGLKSSQIIIQNGQASDFSTFITDVQGRHHGRRRGYRGIDPEGLGDRRIKAEQLASAAGVKHDRL